MILVSKSQIKLITSLQQKKYRNKFELFVAEGPKVINELIAAKLQIHSLYTTVNGLFKSDKTQIITEKEIKKISFLKNANNSVAVFKIPNKTILNEESPLIPKSPYAASKVFAHQMTQIYRDSYDLFFVNGILFNHESPYRVKLLLLEKLLKQSEEFLKVYSQN